MKIGVVSDTHLSRVDGAFKAIYERYLADKDIILHAGDVVSVEVIEFLDRNVFYGVHGNMDPSDVRSRLPRKRIIRAGKFRIGLLHGWGPGEGLEDRILPEFNGVDAIVYGHSHRAANHVRGGVLFFNPGTATGYTRSGKHSLGVIDVSESLEGEIVTLRDEV